MIEAKVENVNRSDGGPAAEIVGEEIVPKVGIEGTSTSDHIREAENEDGTIVAAGRAVAEDLAGVETSVGEVEARPMNSTRKNTGSRRESPGRDGVHTTMKSTAGNVNTVERAL